MDVQKDRLEASIVAWGEGEEAWLLERVILPGDTAQPDVWAELGDVLTDAGVQFACIDSGYNTSMVYAFVKPRGWCRAIKGLSGTGRPLVEDEKIRRQRLRRQRKTGVRPEPLGVDQGKALLYARLKQMQPGPGYIHFPRQPAFDDDYFSQLAAEKLVTKFRGTRPVQEWVQTRPRNETLDCLNYALAAALLLRRWRLRDDSRLIAEQLTLAALALALDLGHIVVFGWPLGYPLPGPALLLLPFIASFFLVSHALLAALLAALALARRR